MAKLADASDLGSDAERREGSTPFLDTKLMHRWRNWQTHKPEALVSERTWRFKSSSVHERLSVERTGGLHAVN